MTADVFRGAGSLRRSYDAVAWASTSLGPVEQWGQTLRDSVRLMLATRFPVSLRWGPDFVMLYNEAYVELIAEKHPRALGAAAADVFPEAWALIGPMLRAVSAGADGTWVEETYVPLERSGYVEECYFTFSYSPVHEPGGTVAGVMAVATETTSQVVVGRRLALLSRLGDELADIDDLESLRWQTLSILDGDREDLPEVDLHFKGPAGHGVPTSPTFPPGVELVETGAGAARSVWLRLASERRHGPEGLLAVRVSDRLPYDDGYREFLEMLATVLVEAMTRIDGLTAERSLSAALQTGLLTPPPPVAGVELAVRYLPASAVAQVGGDWYDAFALPDGTSAVVVGDVAGHDRDSAAVMGQLRSLTRGIAYTSGEAPAAVLSRLDAAMAGLGVSAVATALVARLHRREDDSVGVTWSSAGHPPPLLIAADGSTRLLGRSDDLLLGLDPATRRTDHTVELAPGDSLVLYTDGLVERRGSSIDERLAELVADLDGLGPWGPQRLCDHLLGRLDDRLGDDVAVLVARVDPAA